MLSRTSRIIIIATLAVAGLGASPALAIPIDPVGPVDARGGHAVSPSVVADARGEQAASLAATAPRVTVTEPSDLRTESAREPLQPVVVEVDEPAVSGFDWSAAAIGAAGSLGLLLLAGAAVLFARHRPARTMVS
jgi:hypothetical protein